MTQILFSCTCACMLTAQQCWPIDVAQPVFRTMINKKKIPGETDNFYRIKADFCFCGKKNWVLSFIGVLYARAYSKVIYNYGCIKISSLSYSNCVLADRKWWRKRQLNIWWCFFLNIRCMAIMRRSLWDRQSLNTFPICKKIVIDYFRTMMHHARANERKKTENKHTPAICILQILHWLFKFSPIQVCER